MNYSQWAAVNVTWTPPDDEGPHVIAGNILSWKRNRKQLFAKIWGHSNEFTLNTALPWVHSNTPTKCEADWINSCQGKQRTHTHTHTDIERDSFFYREVKLCNSPVALKESEGSIICSKRLLWLTSRNTDSVFFFYIFTMWIQFKCWLQVALCLCFFSHLLQCDQVHRQLQLMLWVPPTHCLLEITG